MILCVPVAPGGKVDPSWGRAARVAIADVQDGAIVSWEAVDVGWDALHDVGTEGGHHARVARFLRERGVEVVVANHAGEPMVQMLDRMGVAMRFGAAGDARQAVLAVAAGLA